MLDELLKHDNLGDPRELLFVLFRALDASNIQKREDLKRFCVSHLFSIGRSIEGILELLKFLLILNSDDNDSISLDLNVFDPQKFTNPTEYFETTHFYTLLFGNLLLNPLANDFFNRNNIKFSKESHQFYVQSNLIDFKFFPLRNLLLRLSFLNADETIPNHLFVASTFTTFFQTTIVGELESEIKKSQITLEQLEKSLENKVDIGRKGELFVLAYEIDRLAGHPNEHQKEYPRRLLTPDMIFGHLIVWILSFRTDLLRLRHTQVSHHSIGHKMN